MRWDERARVRRRWLVGGRGAGAGGFVASVGFRLHGLSGHSGALGRDDRCGIVAILLGDKALDRAGRGLGLLLRVAAAAGENRENGEGEWSAGPRAWPDGG